ncbi:C40 family peptidase [Thermostaphylospora chromogena]|uniref:Cell wall-associated hydrolase, NlpC family n=1 Tax=Thermostaphylospora chromogena TaxID=35622 RepID=A0A1H1G4Q2_9ACTN|nr:C40 family peptidase [Thermostaphylospora chromogena]SDR08214.1 Cell wall-associated hydrolase, NlpC family [Thermostaphylospora chromogena]
MGGAALTLTTAGAVTPPPTTTTEVTSTASAAAPSATSAPVVTEPPVSTAGLTATTTVASAVTPAAGSAMPQKSEAAASKKGKRAKRKPSKVARQRIMAAKAVSVAKKQIGDPYQWGASGPHAFDCSGLVYYSWKKAGVRLPRVTYAQYARVKKKVAFRNLKPGDLLFFRGKGHVGMYVGKGKMIHAPSRGKTVRIEKLSGWRRASFSGAVRPGL